MMERASWETVLSPRIDPSGGKLPKRADPAGSKAILSSAVEVMRTPEAEAKRAKEVAPKKIKGSTKIVITLGRLFIGRVPPLRKTTADFTGQSQ